MFKERLLQVLAGRKKIAWGEEIGLYKSTVSRMFGGEIPGYEILNNIMRKENVSLSWLMDNKGPAYLIEVCATPKQFYELIQEHTRESWQYLYICNAPGGLSLVFENPGQSYYKEALIEYTVVEVLSGPVDSEVMNFIYSLEGAGSPNSPFPEVVPKQLNPEDAYNLVKGKIGTYQLFGGKGAVGILEAAMEPMHISDLLKGQSGLTDPADPLLLRAVIEHIENMLIEESIELETPDKAKLITGLYRHAAKTGSLDKDTAEALLETIAL